MFLKICPKKSITPKNDELDTKETLDLFIKCNYDISGVSADMEWLEDF